MLGYITQMPKQVIVNFSLIVSVLLLMMLNYSSSFIPSYDIGGNADDKTVILLSSQSSLLAINSKKEIFDKIISKCEIESSNAGLCIDRYSYRANTVGNYFLPGALIDYGIDTTSVNFNKSLSSAFFIGLSLLVAIVFLYILFVMCKANTQGSIFVLISFVFISLANPYIFNIDFSIFSSVFTPSVGYGYLPLIYVPRGVVSYLLIPIILSLVYKNNKLLIASLVLAGLIHLGYSVIYTSIVLVASIVNSFIFKEENKNVYMIIGLLLFLVLVMISQSIYSTESIVTINFGNLNFSDLKLSLNFSTIAFYLVLLLLLFLSLSKPIKKYIIMIFIVNIFLEALLFFELTGILNSDSISQRMAGSFSYLVISMFTLVILYIVNNFNKMYKNNKLTILILPAFLLWANGLNHVYIINKLSENSNIESYKKKLSQSYMKTSIVKSDITSYIIDQNNAKENQLHWLSSVNGVYYIDVDKIKRMNFEDLDIDNEFLVFLYLYIKST